MASAGVGVQVGAAMVATRFVADQLEPASLAMLRYAIGFMCLAPLLAGTAWLRFRPADFLPIAGLGILQFGVLIALINFGLKHIPAGRAALIFTSFPLLAMLVAAVLGQERLTWRKSLGVLLTMLGVALALGEKLFATGREMELLGGLAVLAAALCGAVCSVLFRPYLARYPVLHVSAFSMLASVFALVLGAAGEGFFTHLPPPVSGAGWLAVLFIGLSSGGGYYLWLWALSRTSATEVTVFLSLSPLAASLLGALLLGEILTFWLLAGLAAVIFGLFLATRSGAERRESPPAT
ncbi:MAG: DMT family transporter [Alphaproteobacteria bacterium]|nr:DMT family transporter [Alphaproteobacteria bacterium]